MFLRRCEIPLRNKGYILKKKSKLYFKSLNISCPRNYPKPLGVPTIEILSIIIEILPGNLISEADAEEKPLLSQREKVVSAETVLPSEQKEKFSNIKKLFHTLFLHP